MDFRNIKSLFIGGKAVSRLLLDGRQVWAKAAPPVGVPYIETDGQSYMDLGFIPTSEFRFEACLRTVAGVDYSEDDRFFGCSVGATVRLMRNMLSYGAAPYGWFFRNSGFVANDFGERDNEYHTFRTYDDGSDVVFAYDGSEIVRNSTYATGNTATMKVGLDIPSLGSHPVRIQSFKAWESGVLIRDLVPYSGPRGVGLLDRVHDVLYTNAGGGTLTYGEEGSSSKTPFVQTKGLSDSFWAVPVADLGLHVNPPSPEQFGFEVDMEFPGEGFHAPDDFASFGFCKANGFYVPNMQSNQGEDDVYAYTLGSNVVPSTVSRVIVSPDARHVVKFEFDPSSMTSSVGVDGESASRILGSASAKFPYDSNFRFGGLSSSKNVTSVTRPAKMKVYSIKIWQFNNLVADLTPYQDGDVVGMVDAVSGSKFPGSNLEYGEE